LDEGNEELGEEGVAIDTEAVEALEKEMEAEANGVESSEISQQTEENFAV
jgi:hypothetical protein